MHKFKVGDEVVYSNSFREKIFITEVGGNYNRKGDGVKTSNFPDWLWVSEDSFELVKNKDEVFYA